MDDHEIRDLEERLKLLRAASRPSEALSAIDGTGRWSPSAQGHILSATTQLERRVAELRASKGRTGG